MSDEWEIFPKHWRPSRDVGPMDIRFYKQGVICITSELADYLKSDYVILMFNKAGNKIGIAPSEKGDECSYKLSKPRDTKTHVIQGMSFLKHYGLQHLVGNVISSIYQEGMIVIDLNQNGRDNNHAGKA